MTLDELIDEIDRKGLNELSRIARRDITALPALEQLDARYLLAVELLANAAEDAVFAAEQSGDNFREELRQAWQHYVETADGQ